MATFITVVQQAITQLLAANRQQTANNRVGLVEAEERRQRVQQAQREQQRVPATQGQETPVNSSRRPLVPLDEVGAFRRAAITQVGHFWWFVESEPVTNYGVTSGSGSFSGTRRAVASDVLLGYKRRSRLYCGDGSKYIEIEHGQTPQQLVAPYNGFPAVEDPPASVNTTVFVRGLSANDKRAGDGADLFVLPTGNGNCILIFFAWNSCVTIDARVDILGSTQSFPNNVFTASCGFPQGGTAVPDPFNPNIEYIPLINFTKNQQKSKTARAFACSNTNIREIAIPGTFQSILDLLLVEQTGSFRYDTDFNSGLGRVYAAFSTNTFYDLNWVNDSEGFSHNYAYFAQTPQVFRSSCDGTDPSSQAFSELIGQIARQIQPTLHWIVEDTSSGAFAFPNVTEIPQEQYALNVPFNYGQWLVPGETPTVLSNENQYYYDPALYRPQPRRGFLMSPARAPLDESPPLAENFAGFGDIFGAVWDWDDPAYCQQICLALGFTAADLVA